MPTGWVGEVDVSSFNFASGLETIYKADFSKGDWAGNLFAYPVDAEGSILFAAERWTIGAAGGVADVLNAQNYDTGRIIFTMKKDGSKIPFRYASLESHQQSDTGGNQKIIDYIRGDRTNEDPSGAKYRKRSTTTVLGDIIHSRPLYVPHSTDPTVYVGANDGMLHAFNADTGTEVFAYVPSFFTLNSANFSNVGDLTTKPYVHQYYVDASPNAMKIAELNKTILVGGVGAGGKGLYALDISDPTPPASEAAAASKILWEITPTTINNIADTSYADLGYTYGVPIIAKLNNGTWAAIVANGYNNKGTNQAVLYIINLQTGAKIAAIATSVSGTSDSNPNGLSNPTAIDSDRDGKVDYVYAGDINGNLWKFDIRNVGAPSVTKLFSTSPATAITGRPTISLHPQGGYMVNFTTGRMFTTADASDTSTVYYAYGLWDNGTTIDPTKVVSQTLSAKTWSSGVFNYNVRTSSSNAVDYTAATPKQGWKLALPAGERVVGDGGLVTNRRFIFSSTNPTITHAPVGGVAQPAGDNWLNEVDFLTGGGGTDPIFDLDANLVLDNADRTTVVSGTGPDLTATGIPVSRYIAVGVLSQPLVGQLQTLSETYFNSNPDLAVAAATAGAGVSNGHFDFDIYYATCTVTSSKYSCPSNTHVHEYDDKYDVTGVNMLAPSLAAFNVKNAIPSPSTKFKVLLANQKMSPAVQFIFGKDPPGDPVTSFQTTAGYSVAAAPWYSTSTVKNIEFALPLDAFTSKDWTGTGDVRAGLVPTATGCVHANLGGYAGGPWMNGALTIQLVKDTTPDSAIQLNVAGDPKMGYRLKNDATSQSYQLAQYTMFWHHPNGKCVGQAGWVQNPPQDTSGTAGASATRAAGSADPRAGEFGSNPGTVTSGGATGGGSTGVSSTVTYTFADGSSVTQTTTKNADGSITITRVYSNGDTESFTIPPTTGGRQADSRAKTGRVSWREMIRP